MFEIEKFKTLKIQITREIELTKIDREFAKKNLKLQEKEFKEAKYKFHLESRKLLRKKKELIKLTKKIQSIPSQARNYTKNNLGKVLEKLEGTQ